MLTSFFWSGDAIRSRCVSDIALSGTVEVPALPARVLADWQRELSSQVLLEIGDVEVMPLARTWARWPDYRRCIQVVSDWARELGLAESLASADVALMACRGARYHHDAEQYADMAFCNLFLSEDRSLDLHFPLTGHRIPLAKGTAVVFDTCQPHGVIQRGSSGFDASGFAPDQDWAQIFLSWELPIEDASVARALEITFDIAASTCGQVDAQHLRLNGARGIVCPDSGRWLPSD